MSALFALNPRAHAQPDSTANGAGIEDCALASLDTDLSFGTDGSAYTTFNLTRLNLSDRACLLNEHWPGIGFVPDRLEGGQPFGMHPYGINPLRLEPGRSATLTYRWLRAAPDETVTCLEPKWMSGPALVAAPSLIGKVCSEVYVSQWRLNENPEAPQASGSKGEPPAFKIGADKTAYDEGEWFPLRVSLDLANPAGQQFRPDDVECPVMYLRERSPDGGVRLDEITPRNFKACKQHPFNREASGDWDKGFEVESGALSRWQGNGQHSFQMFTLMSPAGDGAIRWAASNVLRLDVIDPATLARKWGPTVRSLHIDLTLDKDTYRVGEEIPLHLAIEALDPELPVLTWDEVWDPCMAVGVRVLDDKGVQVPDSELFSLTSPCMGHGFGPRPIAAHKIVPVERLLGAMGGLPKQPGIYTIVAIWSANVGVKIDPEKIIQSPDANSCVQARTTAIIHIVDEANPR